MKREINENIDKKEIERNIEELRDVLNEICATDENLEGVKKRLIVSEQLDRLIVKYMNVNNEQRVNMPNSGNKADN